MTAALHDVVGERLSAIDQRYTSQRQSLVDLLAALARPVAIPELLAERPDLPQSSVYRNLAVLEQAGAVRRVLAGDEFARFELAEELTGHHHHHLVCVGCGAVEDVVVPPTFERTLERAAEAVASAEGFILEAHRLDLLGRCRACA